MVEATREMLLDTVPPEMWDEPDVQFDTKEEYDAYMLEQAKQGKLPDFWTKNILAEERAKNAAAERDSRRPDAT